MKHPRVLAVLCFAVALLALSQSAFAFYHPTAGRWLQRDPVGINYGLTRGMGRLANHELINTVRTAACRGCPAGFRSSGTDPVNYGDTPNLYLYVGGRPCDKLDPAGLMPTSYTFGCCGPDITDYLKALMKDIDDKWSSPDIDADDKERICYNRWPSPFNSKRTWDVDELAGNPPDINKDVYCEGNCPYAFDIENPCRATVVVKGQCYDTNQVNYIFWGKMGKLCDSWQSFVMGAVQINKLKGKVFQGFETAHEIEALGWTLVGYKYGGNVDEQIPNSQHTMCSLKNCKSTYLADRPAVGPQGSRFKYHPEIKHEAK